MNDCSYSFTLIDNQGKNFDKVGDTFYLPHNSEFKIVFHNRSDKRANVEFLIDGTIIGEFRSNSHSNIKLERPVNKEKLFTFVSVDSEEGVQGRLDLAPKLGNIEINVDPELEYTRSVIRNVVCDSASSLSLKNNGTDQLDCAGVVSSSIGGTVLGKSSNQRFTFAEYMPTTGKIVKLSAKMKVKTNIESLHQ